MSKAEGFGFARVFKTSLRLTTYALLLGGALVAPHAGAASAQLDVSNVGRGSPAQYVKVAGRGFSGVVHGSDLRVTVEEIRIESTGKLSPVRYSALGIAVFQGGKMLGANWNFDIGKELTPALTTVVLNKFPFTVPWVGPRCEEGGCEVRLQLRVETGSDAHAEHTDLAMMAVTSAPVVARPAPPPPGRPGAGPAPEARRTVDKEIDRALAALEKNRRAEAEKLLEEALAIAAPNHKPGARHPLAAEMLYQASTHYERLKAPRQQELALHWSLVIAESLPAAEMRKVFGHRFDKQTVARRLADFYWNARRYDRAFEYYDRAYRHVADLGLQPPTANVLLAFNSAGRMAAACHLGKWDIADAAMKELKDRATRVDASTRAQLDYWIRTGEPRLKARKC